MEEVPVAALGSRRNEDIALDLMKFVAMTTGYGKTTSSGVGFQGSGAAAKPEDYAAHLLELYGKCLQAVAGKSSRSSDCGPPTGESLCDLGVHFASFGVNGVLTRKGAKAVRNAREENRFGNAQRVLGFIFHPFVLLRLVLCISAAFSN